MQVSIVNKLQLERTVRIDAEYYQPHFMSLEETLTKKGITTLANICEVSDGNHMSISKYFIQSQGVPYFRGQDISDFFLENTNPVCIPENKYNENLMKRSHFQHNDVLLTIVGTIGNISLVTEKFQKATGSCKIAILRPKNISPKYLSAFLLSKYGQQQIKRNIRGAVQTGFILEDFDQVFVYVAPSNFQLRIENLISKSISINSQSTQSYKQAEYLLLSELGLTDWWPKHQLSFVKNFSDTHQVERIDAEYFQPKYDEIVDAIKTYKGGWDTLDNLVKIKKSIEPGSDAYQESGVPFVRVSNLSKYEITNNNQQYISDELYQCLIKYQPKQNEILLSKDATPGIAFHLKEKPNRMIPSGGILRLTVRNRERPSEEYLTLVLNSTLVQQQILRDAGGSIIKHWRLDQVKNTLIPILGKEKQKEIKSKIENSFDCRKKSKQLLKIAKQGVEMAIEQNEAMAKEWIKMQIQNLDISLNDEE